MDGGGGFLAHGNHPWRRPLGLTYDGLMFRQKGVAGYQYCMLKQEVLL